MLRSVKRVLILLAFAGSTVPPLGAQHAIPVFPGAAGFGVETPGGRYGQIHRVVNLEDSGPGSLRAALEAPGARIVVFDVAGEIVLFSDLVVRTPFLTLAGQTAPEPGISLRGAGLRIVSHDILIQHLRIRVGDALQGPAPRNRDALQLNGPDVYNVVIDHVSASWAIDEVFSTWYPVRNVTISHCLFSEGLAHSRHPKGTHSMGVLIGPGAHRVALLGNLIAHNAERQPRVSGDTSVLLANNLLYNCASKAHNVIGSEAGATLESAVGNVFLRGPDTPAGAFAIHVTGSAQPGTRLHLQDNQSDLPLVSNAAAFPVESSDAPFPDALPALLPSGMVAAAVLANAGARPLKRDPVDLRIVYEVSTRTGRIIDRPEQVGGWPSVPAAQRTFQLPENPHGDLDGDGYTNIEEYLHRLAASLEPSSPPTPRLKSGSR